MSKPVRPRTASPPRPVGDRRPILRAMLNPKSVALIGATEATNSVGRTLMDNLRSFSGSLFPVNPKRTSVLGIKAFPRIADVPGPVDLAIIATPAIAVPDVVSECAEAGVKGAVIISGIFQQRYLKRHETWHKLNINNEIRLFAAPKIRLLSGG